MKSLFCDQYRSRINLEVTEIKMNRKLNHVSNFRRNNKMLNMDDSSEILSP